MSEEQEANGVGTPEVSDTGDQSNDQGNRTVSYESLRKVLGEKKKETAKRRELEQRLAEIEAEKEAAISAELAEQGKFKDLLEQERKKREALEADLTHYQTTVQNSVKFNAIKRTLGADIDHKWTPVLKANKIYDTVEIGDDGRPEEMSVTKACEFIRKELPEIIAQAPAGRTPADAPRGTSQLSYEDWLKLPVDEMRQRQKEVID